MNKDYDPKIHLTEINKIIQEKVGDPVDPSWDILMKKWKGMCEYLLPRTFMFIIDIKKAASIATYGMSVLGYQDDWAFSSGEFMGLIHENQQYLVGYQTFRVYELFFNDSHLIKDKGIVYCTSRGIKDSRGKYWLTHQTGMPFQYDENGITVRYLSTYRLLGEYKGEALETEVFAAPQFRKEEKELNRQIRQIKMDMLDWLGFTRPQKKIIDFMAVGLTKSEIAKEMETSVKALNYHIGNILNIGREAFPLNNFKEGKDVVDYLVQQKIV